MAPYRRHRPHGTTPAPLHTGKRGEPMRWDNNVARLLIARGETIMDLSRALGYRRDTLSKAMRGQEPWSGPMARKVARYLGVSVAVVKGNEDLPLD